MDNNRNDIELRTEEFQEILGKAPAWIFRRGIMLAACIVGMLLAGSALFRYPDIMTATMILTGSNPPTSLVAKTSGKLCELYIADKEKVGAGHYLAVIENTAQTADVLVLKTYLQNFAVRTDTISYFPDKELKLGTMQPLYSSFYLTLFNYQEFLKLQYYTKKIGLMQKQIDEYRAYANTVNEQLPMTQTQTELQHNVFLRDSLLYIKGLISTENLENSQSQYMQSRLSVKNLEASIQNIRMQVNQLDEDLLDIEQQYIEKNNELKNGLKTIVSQLLAEIEHWEQMYVLISPIDGEVAFTNYWTTNQNVIVGENVFTVIPDNSQEMTGKAKMSAIRSGKVKPGQRVNIHFANFPDMEYGVVKGTVRNVSIISNTDVQSGSYYTVEIDMPAGLRTTYHKELPYMPGMQAQADIVTEDISLLERFFLPLKRIWKGSRD